MELVLRPAPQPWKAAVLAVLFILITGFTVGWAISRTGPAARTMCRCAHTNPAQRCFCPPLGNSCPCER